MKIYDDNNHRTYIIIKIIKTIQHNFTMIEVRFLLQFFSGLLLVAFELIAHEVVEPTGVFLSTDGFLMVQAKGHQQGRARQDGVTSLVA